MPLVSAPSDEAKEVVAQFRWFRGGTLSGFAQLEFSMCRLLSRMKERPNEFDGLDKFPYRAESRAHLFKQVFQTNENLQTFKEQAVLISDRFLVLIELRNYLSHGFSRINMQTKQIEIRRFVPTKTNEWNEDQWNLNFRTLVPLGQEIDEYTNFSVGFCIEVSNHFKLDF